MSKKQPGPTGFNQPCLHRKRWEWFDGKRTTLFRFELVHSGNTVVFPQHPHIDHYGHASPQDARTWALTRVGSFVDWERVLWCRGKDGIPVKFVAA